MALKTKEYCFAFGLLAGLSALSAKSPAVILKFKGTFLSPKKIESLKGNYQVYQKRLENFEKDLSDYWFWIKKAKAEKKEGHTKQATVFTKKAMVIKRYYKYTRYYKAFVKMPFKKQGQSL